MDRPKVFVSFSSKDRTQIRRLLARLDAQPIELWNYAEESQEIPGGNDIPDFLKEQIDRSDYFLPFVTLHSFASPYTCLEVSHALTRHTLGKPQIIPLVTPECPSSSVWPNPYQHLTSLRFRTVDFQARTSLEEAVVTLCADMRVRYLPLPTMDPRLPFMDRFVAEVREKCARHEERDIAIYSRLMHVLNEFDQAFEEGDFRRALARIAYFVLMCEYEFPEERFYYPWIVKAICEVACGRLRIAAETLENLLDHPSLDENVFGLMGYIYQQEEMYPRALECYREAVRRAPSDPAAKMGEVINALLCEAPIDIDAAFRNIETQRIHNSDDRLKVDAVKMFALGRVGRIREAEELFNRLVRDGAANASLVVNFARALADHRSHRQARDLLLRFYTSFADEHLLHLLASLCFQIGDEQGAVHYFEELVRCYPLVRQYRIDAAQVFWRAGDHARAKEIASSLLNPRVFPLPATPADFFYDGFANWLLGNYERADYDFARSSMPQEKHYHYLLESLGR